jgi:hypothetical protein
MEQVTTLRTRWQTLLAMMTLSVLCEVMQKAASVVLRAFLACWEPRFALVRPLMPAG